MPPLLEVGNACAAPAPPIMLAPAGAAPQDVLLLSSRRAESHSTPYKSASATDWKRSGRLFPNWSSRTSWTSEDAANSLLSPYPVRGLPGPDVALRISLRIF